MCDTVNAMISTICRARRVVSERYLERICTSAFRDLGGQLGRPEIEVAGRGTTVMGKLCYARLLGSFW
jgi:hypothetical protein